MKHPEWISAFAVTCLALSATAPAGELRGRILADDKPVAGATVAAIPFESPFAEARREARREETPKPVASAATRPDGTFALTIPPPSTSAAAALVRIEVRGGGLVPALLEPVFDTSENASAGDVGLVKAATLAGKVVDGRGGPVVGATVTLFPGTGAAFFARVDASSLPVSATTGADGTFRFAEAGARGNRLRIEAPGFGVAEVAGAAAGALRRPVAMSIGRTLSGQVVRDDHRTPAAGSLVRFEGRSTSRWHEVRADGAFLLDGLPAEPGALVADGGDKGRGSATVEAGAAKATVVLAPTASLKGRVVDAATGAPLARMKIVARAEGAPYVARSGPDGRYEIRGLPARSYRLAADDPAYVPWSRDAVRVAPGATAAQDVILTQAATLLGRILDERGLPIEGATGRLTAGGSSGPRAFFAMMRGDAAFRSGRDGSFSATRLAPGDGQILTVQHPDYEQRVIGGLALQSKATSRVNVVLRSGLSTRGLVKDEHGRPLAGAEVELQREMRFQSRGGGAQVSFIGGPGSRPRKETGADGRFEFKGLSAGDYTLTVTMRGYGREHVDPVKVAEGKASEPIEIVVRPGATISGYVRDKAGNGAAGYRVAARPAGGAGGRGPMAGPLGGPTTDEPTAPDGAFVIEGVSAGESYDLQVFGDSGLGPRKAGISAPADGVELQVDGRGRIRGTVLDAETGRALRDFEVSYEPSRQGGMMFRFGGPRGRGRGPGEPLAVHADDGSFTLDDVAAGKWDVEVRAPGYEGGRVAGVSVEEGGTAEGVDVRLSRGGVISGRVTDARSAQPVREATLRAELSGGGGGPRMRFGPEGSANEASSDADGQFQITGLSAGSYTVTATHPDWTEATERVELKEATAQVNLKMTTGAAVGGTVMGAGQRPVAGASVALSAGGGGMRGPFGEGDQSTITDAAGRFRFERLGAGRYSLTASLRSQSSASVEVVIQANDPGRDVTLSLGLGATVRGLVTGLPEALRAGVNVNASGLDDFFATTRTGADGAFELTGVPAGPLNLNARAGDFVNGSRSASAQVVVGEGQLEANAEIVFEPGFRLDGHVSRGGKPITDAIVNAFPQGGGRNQGASGRTDESGAFALEGLQAGTYDVQAMPMSGGGAIRRTLSITADTSLDLDAPLARLAGSVVEQGSGRPLADAQVRIEEQGRGLVGMHAASTDSNGRFALEGLEAKDYLVAVQKAAYQTETKSLAAGDPSGDLVIELKRGEGIGVVARDGIYGTPLRGLTVRVLAGGVPVFSGGVALDSEGRGEIPSLRPGTYELRADSQGYAPLSVPQIAVPAPSITLTLTPGGTLEIHAGPQTLGLPNASARILYPNGAVYSPFLFSPDGLIRLSNPIRRLENLAPGSYILAVDGGSRKPFEISEGGFAVVSLP